MMDDIPFRLMDGVGTKIRASVGTEGDQCFVRSRLRARVFLPAGIHEVNRHVPRGGVDEDTCSSGARLGLEQLAADRSTFAADVLPDADEPVMFGGQLPQVRHALPDQPQLGTSRSWRRLQDQLIA